MKICIFKLMKTSGTLPSSLLALVHPYTLFDLVFPERKKNSNYKIYLVIITYKGVLRFRKGSLFYEMDNFKIFNDLLPFAVAIQTTNTPTCHVQLSVTSVFTELTLQ